MRKALIYILLMVFFSCEDQVEIDLPEAPSIVVIDAFLTTEDSLQSIRVTQSQTYFDNTPLTGIAGADVKVTNLSGSEINFSDVGNGVYEWMPAPDESIAVVGDSLVLQVAIGEDIYQASSKVGRVPDIDSVTFRYEEETIFFPESYFAEFWSRDFIGAGDTYWIKSYKNGVFLNLPSEINIAFDAGFSEGGNVDGLIFIPPIRDAINPFEEDEDDEFVSPFEDGDSVFVEIYSITEETFFFLNDVRIQTDRPGGFAELFAVPLSNVRTNIEYLGNQEELVVAGFFNVSAVKGLGKTLDISEVPKED